MIDETKQVIDRVDKYLSLVRYEYATQEHLSKLKTLDAYYGSLGKLHSSEKLKSTIEGVEQLSNDLRLPLKVRGKFLIEGKPKGRYYRAVDLEKAASNPINGSFPLMLDHRVNEAGQTIGKVTKIWYDDNIKGLRWKGHVNSELHALNVIDGVIKEVSVTVNGIAEYDDVLGTVWTNLTFDELSFVKSAAVKDSLVEVDN